jgi:hypothetical protein
LDGIPAKGTEPARLCASAPGYNGGGERAGQTIAVRGYYRRIADMLDLDRLGERLPGPPATGFFARHGKLLRRVLVGGFLFLAGSAAVLFAGDYAVLRYRMTVGNSAFGTVTVRPYYSVRLKNGKTEFLFQEAQPETCVNSLFPHFDTAPCWYLRHRPEKRTEI